MHAQSPTPERIRHLPWPYPSAWIFMGFVAVFLALLNIPGQIDVDSVVERSKTLGSDGNGWYVHGWPLTALRRGPFYVRPDAKLPSPWKLGEDVHDAVPWAVGVNSLVAILLILAGGVLFQVWRRRGGSLRSFRLSTLIVFVALVALAAQYFVGQRAAGQADRAAVKAMQADPSNSALWIQWQPWGPTWLRLLIGDGWFEGCDRVVSISGLQSRDFAKALTLGKLKFVAIGSDISNYQLHSLSQLPDLEDLDMYGCFPQGSGIADVKEEVRGQWPRFAFPSLPKLRSLDLRLTRFRLAGLENLPQLENLNLAGSLVQDDDLRAIGQMVKLRMLMLNETDISSAGLAHIAGLKHLLELYVEEAQCDDTAIQQIAPLTQLQDLGLAGRRITDASIPHLQRLVELQWLGISNTAITAGGLARLAGLHKLRELSLTGPEAPGADDTFEVHRLAALSAVRDLSLQDYSLTDADVQSLGEFTHLERLYLGNTEITAAGFAALRAALPNCTIDGD